MSPAAPDRFRSVLLVGFMGSGKSTVGRIAAELLGWELVDVDARVEADAGRAIPVIFRESGEAAFRELEAAATRAALEGRHTVIATGGGWPARDGRMESVPDDVLTVWLRVTPETAVERSLRDGTGRPLLDVPDPVTRARELLEARRPFYARAGLHLDTEATSPERLGRAMVEYLRTGGTTDRR